MTLFLSSMTDQLFNSDDELFSFESHGVTITCQRVPVAKQAVYYVSFSSTRQPITIARAKFVDSDTRWTSIPEGRQKEAEGVGKLIDEYLATKK
jgi:hypothetical protein